MNIASIDIGSNTVLMLIAEVDLQTKHLSTIKNYYEMPRLAKGLKSSGRISDEKIYSLYKILNFYKSEIEKYKCGKVIATATNAFRIAKNANEIINKVKKKFDINIDVIEGQDEAVYSYLGASSLSKENQLNAVIDIGGGSTEIIIGQGKEIIFKKSFPDGAVSLTEQFIKNDPPVESEINQIENYIKDTFKELTRQVYDNLFAIAVAGTPTSLSCIQQKLTTFVESKVEGHVLSSDDLSDLSNLLKSKSSKQILNDHKEVVKGREDVITSGAILLKEIANLLKTNRVTVSGKGIRYGAVINFMNNI
ncbi:MAG: hypothetical protein K9J16_02580 [Melioribacteraceae bacterium]|nr:hypothetical protein [Melioribacteraceae bacterium]MCF8352894.1 hypothetical protein [Melioribacteraceae bacterium]MCF8393789.1 hypothetical protein [Melioribacteraceae bacterium]MCF8417411.1 hypothetical protein [Melioribacteraceae bacterium]